MLAPVDGAVDSDVPIQSVAKKSRLGELHLASVRDKRVVAARAKSRCSDMKA